MNLTAVLSRPPFASLSRTGGPRLTLVLDVLTWTGIAVGMFWRAAQVARSNPMQALWSDPARNWEFGSLGTETHPLVFVDPIGYQTWLAAVQKLTLGQPGLVWVVTVALSWACPWLWYRFLREMLPSRRWARFGWALFALLPSWIGITSYFMMETLFLPLLGLALWMTWRALRRGDRRSFVLMVLAWLAAGLTRSVAGPMAAAAVGLVWFWQDGKTAKAAWTLAIVGPALLFLGLRSKSQTGIFAPLGIPYLAQAYAWSGRQEILIHYTSTQGETYDYGFGSPISNEAPLQPLSDWKTGRTGSFIVNIDLADQKADWKEALSRARQEGWSWPRVAGENLVYLMMGGSWPDSAVERLAERATQSLRWIWVPLLLFVAMEGALRRRALGRSGRLLAAIFGAWLVVQGLLPISVNEGRYRKPAEGLLIAAVLAVLSPGRLPAGNARGLARWPSSRDTQPW